MEGDRGRHAFSLHLLAAGPAPRRGCATGTSMRPSDTGATARQSCASALALASFASRYARWMALTMPRSPTGMTSGRCSRNMRNISAVHRPIPFTFVNSATTPSSSSDAERVEVHVAAAHARSEVADIRRLRAAQAGGTEGGFRHDENRDRRWRSAVRAATQAPGGKSSPRPSRRAAARRLPRPAR